MSTVEETNEKNNVALSSAEEGLEFLGRGEGLIKIDGLTVTIKCRYCGGTFNKTLPESCDSTQNILEVDCPCSAKYPIRINRKF